MIGSKYVFIAVTGLGLIFLSVLVRSNQERTNDIKGVTHFSTKVLNQYFERKGYSKDFWSYHSPVKIQRMNEDLLLISDSSSTVHFSLSRSGILTRLNSDDNWIAKKNVYFKLIEPVVRDLLRHQKNVFPISDKGCILLGLRYFDVDAKGRAKNHRFTVLEVDSQQTICEGKGHLIFLRSHAEEFEIVVSYPERNQYTYMKYTTVSDSLAPELIIERNATLPDKPKSFVRGISDVDSKQMVLVQYGISGERWPKGIIYLVKGDQIYSSKLPDSSGNWYAVIGNWDFIYKKESTQ